MGSPGQHTTKLVLVRQVQPLEPTPQHHQSPTTATHTTTQRSSADTNQQQTTSKQTSQSNCPRLHHPTTPIPQHIQPPVHKPSHTLTQLKSSCSSIFNERIHDLYNKWLEGYSSLTNITNPKCAMMQSRSRTSTNTNETFDSADHQLNQIQEIGRAHV